MLLFSLFEYVVDNQALFLAEAGTSYGRQILMKLFGRTCADEDACDAWMMQNPT